MHLTRVHIQLIESLKVKKTANRFKKTNNLVNRKDIWYRKRQSVRIWSALADIQERQALTKSEILLQPITHVSEHLDSGGKKQKTKVNKLNWSYQCQTLVIIWSMETPLHREYKSKSVWETFCIKLSICEQRDGERVRRQQKYLFLCPSFSGLQAR